MQPRKQSCPPRLAGLCLLSQQLCGVTVIITALSQGPALPKTTACTGRAAGSLSLGSNSTARLVERGLQETEPICAVSLG